MDIERRGLSFFGEGRQGPTGWAGIGGIEFFDPNANVDGDQRRRLIFGSAHWSEVGRGRLGIVISARAGLFDGQLTAARAPAARSNPRRVLEATTKTKHTRT